MSCHMFCADLYWAESVSCVIRRLVGGASGTVDTVAGRPYTCYDSAWDGPALKGATINNPQQLLFAGDTLYMTEDCG